MKEKKDNMNTATQNKVIALNAEPEEKLLPPPRFMMFGGKDKSPRGGWHDSMMRCADFNMIKKDFDSMIKSNNYEWIHVVDSYKRDIILYAQKCNGVLKDVTQQTIEQERLSMELFEFRWKNRTPEKIAEDNAYYESMKAQYLKKKEKNES